MAETTESTKTPSEKAIDNLVAMRGLSKTQAAKWVGICDQDQVTRLAESRTGDQLQRVIDDMPRFPVHDRKKDEPSEEIEN